jgi:hypothetical protein
MTDTDTDDTRSVFDIPPGPRYTSSEEILRIEREIGGGDNPARPMAEHPEFGGHKSADELRRMIEREADREAPDRQRIARLNECLQAVTDT